MARNLLFSFLVLFFLFALLPPVAAQSEPRPFVIGFFEGGPYPQHEAFRENYRLQLEGMKLPSVELIFAADAFRSAGWNRDSSRIMAGELAAQKDISLMIALGPWVVHDLLAAGFEQPILAVHQTDPFGAGLLNEAGRPIAENLAIGYDPEKLERDITYVSELMRGKKLGFLHFPSGVEHDRTVVRVEALGKHLGLEVVTAEGFDNKGTFAFFKAYQALPDDLDAIYVTPLYGLDAAKTKPFFDMLLRDRLPLFSGEGRFHTARGACLTLGSDNMIAESYYHADRTRMIIEGATPSQLPLEFHLEPQLAINLASAQTCRLHVSRDLVTLADLFDRPISSERAHYDLLTALDHALAANPSLLGSAAALEQAQAQQGVVASKYRPSLSIDGELAWLSDNSVHNSFDEFKSRRSQVQLRLRQKIFDLETMGKKSLAVSDHKLAVAENDSVRFDLQRDVTLAYYDLLQAGELEQLVAEYRRRIDLALEAAYARNEADRTDATARLRWKYERMNATRLLVETRASQRIAQGQFNILLSQPYATEVELSAAVASVNQLVVEYSLFMPLIETSAVARQSLDRLGQLALEHRPHLVARRVEVLRANQLLSLQKRSFYPKIGFQAALGLQDKLADRFGFVEETTQWEALLNLSWSLFEGGGRLAQTEKNRAGLDRAEYESDVSRLRILNQVYSSGERLLGLIDGIPAVNEAKTAAENYLNLTTRGYLEGSVDLLTALDAQENWLAARLDEIEVRYDYYHRCAELLRDLGGNLTGRGNTPGQALINYLAK